jgi:Ca2+-binding RTX toxin-like protein
MENGMSRNENHGSENENHGSGRSRQPEVSEHHANPPTPLVPVSPHVDTFTFAAAGNQTAKVDRISAKEGPEQFVRFNPTGGDVLNLANVLKGSAATLATLGNYITATTSAAGDTTLSFDATGTGLAGTAFAVLKGVSITVPQLLADHALAINAATPIPLGSTTHVTLVQNNATLTYGNGNYDISVTGTGENITVGNGNSEISGPQGASTVTTGTGRQEIFLTGTNNVITVGDNTTTGVTEIFAGTGSDHVTAGAGSVYIVGSGNADTITVGNGNDTIVETAHSGVTVGINLVTLGSGNDAVFLGGSGNTVRLGSGTDRVVGGTGLDTFVVNAAGGTDTISNFSLTNGDTLDLTKILSTASLAHDLSNLGSFVTLASVVDTAVSTGLDTKLTITGGGGSASVTLLNSGPMALTDLVSHGSLVLPPH